MQHFIIVPWQPPAFWIRQYKEGGSSNKWLFSPTFVA